MGESTNPRGKLRFDRRPWNDRVWELEGGPDGASCRPTRESPDLVLSASEVGAVYLGGGRFAPLLGAGRIEERATGAAARADSMFATRLQPWAAAS